MTRITDTHIRNAYDLGKAYAEIFPNEPFIAEYWPDGKIDFEALAENVLFEGPSLGEFDDNGAWVWMRDNWDDNDWRVLAAHYNTVA